jgi:drug/metabolite transporter (DMT)-like permease
MRPTTALPYRYSYSGGKAKKVQRQVRTDWIAIAIWIGALLRTSVIVKTAVQSRTDLLFGQFVTAGIVLVVLTTVVGVPVERERFTRGQIGWLAARIVIGAPLTFVAYESLKRCFGFAPTLIASSAILLPLLGFLVPSLLAGKRRGVVLACAALGFSGVAIGTANVGADCSSQGLVLGATAAVGSTGLSLVMSRLRVPALLSATWYCLAATVLTALCIALVEGRDLSISATSIELGAWYVLVVVFVQRANRADPVTTNIAGLAQMPLSAIVSQVVFGVPQPPNVWFAIVLVALGVGIMGLKGDRSTR